MATVIENEILSYFTQLDQPEKKSVIQLLRTFVDARKSRDSVTIEEYNQELNEAEVEYERGDFVDHEQLKNSIKAW